MANATQVVERQHAETEQLPAWKERILKAWRRQLDEEADLIVGTLRLRLHSLIGIEIDRRNIRTDKAAARATVDDVTFLLDGADIYVEAACPACGDILLSEPLLTPSDVGQAVSEWLPTLDQQCPHNGEAETAEQRLLAALQELIAAEARRMP